MRVACLVEDVHRSGVRDDWRLVVELQDCLAPDVHHQSVDAWHVVGHASVGSLSCA